MWVLYQPSRKSLRKKIVRTELEKLDNDIKIKTARKQEILQKLKVARSKARTKKGLDTFDSIVAMLGLEETEEKCVTIADYAKLQDDIIARITELQEFTKNNADVKPEGDTKETNG